MPIDRRLNAQRMASWWTPAARSIAAQAADQTFGLDEQVIAQDGGELPASGEGQVLRLDAETPHGPLLALAEGGLLQPVPRPHHDLGDPGAAPRVQHLIVAGVRDDHRSAVRGTFDQQQAVVAAKGRQVPDVRGVGDQEGVHACLGHGLAEPALAACTRG